MSNSIQAVRPAKPRDDFPLFPHANGKWAKKVRGKTCYFGKWSDDPKGARAIQQWADEKDDLLAGRKPRGKREGLTVRDLVNHFLTAKEQQRDAGDISPRSFADYLATGQIVADAFGPTRLVDDLDATDFQSLRARFAKKWGVHRLGGEVQRVRTLFKFGFDAGLVDRPVRFGPTFKRPASRIMRAHRQKSGPRMIEAAELRKIIDTATIPLKAMILLGINCGFGNNDCGTLPLSALDLDKGWIAYPRPKTAVERRCPLWPETVAALRAAVEARPDARLPAHSRLAFITRQGSPWAKDIADSPITKEFRKLLNTIDNNAAKEAAEHGAAAPSKVHRPGLGFYALRHTFETIGGGYRDQVAVNFIMGHADSSMAGVYRERIDDSRLQAVVDHVHGWLYPRPTVG